MNKTHRHDYELRVIREELSNADFTGIRGSIRVWACACGKEDAFELIRG